MSESPVNKSGYYITNLEINHIHGVLKPTIESAPQHLFSRD